MDVKDVQKVADYAAENGIDFAVVAPDDPLVLGCVDALNEKGYNPINQLVGYIISEDPTYITNYNNARAMICKLDRDELLQELVRQYLA